MRRHRLTVTVVLVMLVLVQAAPAAFAKGTVDFCRPNRDGTFTLQKIGERAAANVAARRGGGVVGDPVSGMPGYVFGDDCSPRLAVIAEAWSTAPDGSTREMARLEDMDGDGAPSSGDVVRTATYPTSLAANAFGSFTTTTFVVLDGSITTAPDGAVEVRARSGCGAEDCWFFWAEMDAGAQGYERYVEYRLGASGLPTDNTGFYDGRDDECDPSDCSQAFDVLSVRPGSPSGPGDLVFDVAVSPADDGFLQVRVAGRP